MLKYRFLVAKYRFFHWVFQWKQDNDGDITFVLFGFLAFTKYKEHTIVRFNGYTLQNAGQYQGHNQGVA